MNADFERLCEAAERARDGADLTQSIVRAVLTELQKVSDEGFEAIETAVKHPRMHVGHKLSDDVRTAYIGSSALINHYLSEPGS